MKLHHLLRRVIAAPAIRTALIVVALLAAVRSLALAETAAAPQEARDYTLFIGGTLEAFHDKGCYPVIRAFEKDLEIEVSRSFKRVPIGDIQKYKIVRELKLANLYAHLSVARVERKQLGLAKAQADLLSRGVALQNSSLDRGQMELGAVVKAAMPSAAGGGANQAIYDALDRFESMGMASEMGSLGFTSKKVAEQAAIDACDTLEMDVDVSSPTPLTGVYLVLVTECRAPQKPDVLLRKISLKIIDRTGQKPVRVSFEQQGFPPGYTLDRERLFLYTNDSEVVTNLSENRMALTREQAFKYLLIQYIASHWKESLPPSPIRNSVPPTLLAAMDPDLLSQTIAITVNKNGEVTRISTGDPMPAKLPPSIEIALRNFRFFPALQNGLPTEGKMKLRISDLFRDS